MKVLLLCCKSITTTTVLNVELELYLRLPVLLQVPRTYGISTTLQIVLSYLLWLQVALLQRAKLSRLLVIWKRYPQYQWIVVLAYDTDSLVLNELDSTTLLYYNSSTGTRRQGCRTLHNTKADVLSDSEPSNCAVCQL